jgi:hypothetical protein
MFRKIMSIVKKWASAPSNRAATQGDVPLGVQEHEAQREPRPNPDQSNAPAELAEDTANEVVATWNLLNPP